MSKNYLSWVAGEIGCAPSRGNSIDNGPGRKEETHENQRRLSCEIGRKEKISEDEASVWTP